MKKYLLPILIVALCLTATSAFAQKKGLVKGLTEALSSKTPSAVSAQVERQVAQSILNAQLKRQLAQEVKARPFPSGTRPFPSYEARPFPSGTRPFPSSEARPFPSGTRPFPSENLNTLKGNQLNDHLMVVRTDDGIYLFEYKDGNLGNRISQ